ncbi:MAG: bifunctional 4-hydroxy-2-oxoglutarate aldolase/2-dehydro-3-deoxy-phosphogluconate aldolase [Saprospiraceae bacterium]|nr:bifunctional 4-hydroxy-2-oxoglutarate aldolase/2-dehydro-3-deoxy-phosphogluconate aldolase [Saprospiraceae bacterium]
MSRATICQHIIDNGIIAIVRTKQPINLVKLVQSYAAGGIKSIEITMNTPGALEAVREISQTMPDVRIGVGTVRNTGEAGQAIEHGARYLVTPITDPEIIEIAHKNDIPVAMGAFTPTEVYNAHQFGADLIKLFPAGNLGIPYMKAVLAPMPPMKLVPTGGINLDNARDWLDAGASALGVGSALVDPQLIEQEDFAGLTQLAKEFASLVELSA